jgi:hypothetical protein
VTRDEFSSGALVKFYDAFNTQKKHETLGVLLSRRKKKSDWGSGWCCRVLLAGGTVAEVFDYEIQVVR